MSHLTALLGRKPAPHKPQPYDHLTKAQLWGQLRAAKIALELTGNAVEIIGRDLHGLAAESPGTSQGVRLANLSVAARRVRDLARQTRTKA